jgi:hypothetical protein
MAAPSLRDAYQFMLGNALSEQEQKSLAATFSAVSPPSKSVCLVRTCWLMTGLVTAAAAGQQDRVSRVAAASCQACLLERNTTTAFYRHYIIVNDLLRPDRCMLLLPHALLSCRQGKRLTPGGPSTCS